MADSDAKDDRGVWRLYSAGLYMRADAGEAGKLALLADVVRWLMSEGGKALPRAEAVEQLCAALEDASPEPELFRARPDTRAILLKGEAALFGFYTADAWEEMKRDHAQRVATQREEIAREQARRVAFEREASERERARREAMRADPGLFIPGKRVGRFSWPPLPNIEADLSCPGLCDPGISSAVRRMRDGASFDDGNSPLLGLAVRASVAHSLWGWGGVDAADASPFQLADYAALVKHRKANPGSDWGLGNQIEIGKAEVDRLMRDGHGKTSALKNMAVDIGCFRQSLERSLYSTERKRKRPAPETPATGSVIRMPRDRRNAA